MLYDLAVIRLAAGRPEDALQALGFVLLGEAGGADGGRLVTLVGRAAGPGGMVGGQQEDLDAESADVLNIVAAAEDEAAVLPLRQRVVHVEPVHAVAASQPDGGNRSAIQRAQVFLARQRRDEAGVQLVGLRRALQRHIEIRSHFEQFGKLRVEFVQHVVEQAVAEQHHLDIERDRFRLQRYRAHQAEQLRQRFDSNRSG